MGLFSQPVWGMIEAYGWMVWYPVYGLSRDRFMDCFVDIVYVTLGLEDPGCCCLVFNNMLDGSCVIRC